MDSASPQHAPLDSGPLTSRDPSPHASPFRPIITQRNRPSHDHRPGQPALPGQSLPRKSALHPSHPTTIRETVGPDRLCAFDIPKRITVYIHANTIHWLSTFWGPDADAFNPDRWDVLPPNHPKNAYIPFLQGPRGCIGRKFAETEMK